MNENESDIFQEMQTGDIKTFRAKLTAAIPDVGSKVLNEDHMGLLSIFFSFQRTMEGFRQRTPDANDWEKVAFDLETLIDLTERHFRTEEEMMERCNHGYLSAHLAEHHVFLRKLEGYRDALERKDTKEILKLKYDLFELFFDHVNITDMKFKDEIGRA